VLDLLRMNAIEAKTSHSQGKPCPSPGRRGRRLPHRRYRTERDPFGSSGSSAYGLLSSASQQLNLTIVAAWSVRSWSWKSSPVFSTLKGVRHKTRTP
jgi:hypothetical protein